MIRIGQINYANVTPLFYGLKNCFPAGDYQYVSGVPAALNKLLADGEIDVCPSSSFAYAVDAEQYFILPELSISSTGAVASVLLFSRLPLEELSEKTILLSSESATSVNLLKILIQKRFEMNCTYKICKTDPATALQEAPSLLLIGDAALRSSMAVAAPYIYDLGTLWQEWTGLPFVFALWFCNRKTTLEKIEEMRTLASRLQVAKEFALQKQEQIAASADEADWIGKERLISYWRDNISYDLGEQELTGLRLFFTYAAEMGLLKKEPELVFLK